MKNQVLAPSAGKSNGLKVKTKARTGAFAAFILAGLVALPACADTVTKNFELAAGSTSTFRTLSVPAKTTVLVSGRATLSNVPLLSLLTQVKVTVEVIRPDGTADGERVDSTEVTAIPGVGVPFAFAMPHSSDFGCPGLWRVRVRPSAKGASPATVTGEITFNYFVPGTVNLDMVGDEATIEGGGSSVTRILSGHSFPFGFADSSLIAHTEGVFRIKADWDTVYVPWLTATFNAYHKLKVQLIRPDGTTADSETGYPQHTPSDRLPSGASKVHFTYTVTAADARMTGSWKLKITNNNETDWFGSPVPIKINHFDIEKFNFSSTFTPQCN